MNKMIPVLLVVIIAAVGASAFFLASDNGDEETPLPDAGQALGLVYGNADGNYIIDETDKKIVQAIIDGEKMFSDFPFADANCDGAVDAKDLEMIQQYIDKVPMRLNVLEIGWDWKKVVQVPHPMDNIGILSGSAMAPLFNVFDVYDRMTVEAYSHVDPIRDAPIDKLSKEGKLPHVDPWGSAASNDILTKTHTKVLVTELHGMYDLDSDENCKVLNDLGIDVLRLECKDPDQTNCSIAIMGIIFDQPDRSKLYDDYCTEVLETIKDKEGAKFGTVTMMGYCGPGFNGQKDSYNEMFTAAGGKNIMDSDEYKSFKEGDQWIYEEKYNAEVFMFMESANYSDPEIKPSKLVRWDRFDNTWTWKNGSVYCYDFYAPKIVSIAYMAEAFYPDCFEDGWADQMHQKYVDLFFHYDGYKVPADRFLVKLN